MPAELATSLTATEAERLEEAESLVRGFCKWHIAPSRTETVSIRSTRTGTVALPSLHVTAVTSVTDDVTPLTVEDDYTWSEAGVLTRAGVWGDGTIVEVEFTHGYATVPPEIRSVVRSVAQRGVDNPGSLTRRTDGPFTDVFSATATLALHDSEKEILRRYRIPTVA